MARFGLLFESLEVALQFLAHRVEEYIVRSPESRGGNGQQRRSRRVFTDFDDITRLPGGCLKDAGRVTGSNKFRSPGPVHDK